MFNTGYLKVHYCGRDVIKLLMRDDGEGGRDEEEDWRVREGTQNRGGVMFLII